MKTFIFSVLYLCGMVHSVYPEGKWTLYTTGMDKEAYAEDISSLGVEGDNIWAGTH